MGGTGSKCCFFCVPEKRVRRRKDGEFDPSTHFTIQPMTFKKEEENEDDFVVGNGFLPESREASRNGDIFFSEEEEEEKDSKSFDEISLSKEMDDRSKEILMSYQNRDSLNPQPGSRLLVDEEDDRNLSLDEQMDVEPFGTSESSFPQRRNSEDSCLPESILSASNRRRESGISLEAYGSRLNPAFYGDEGPTVCHYKTEIVGEVESVRDEDFEDTHYGVSKTLYNRAFSLEPINEEDKLERSSCKFLFEPVAYSDSSSPILPEYSYKDSLEMTEEIQTRL